MQFPEFFILVSLLTCTLHMSIELFNINIYSYKATTILTAIIFLIQFPLSTSSHVIKFIVNTMFNIHGRSTVHDKFQGRVTISSNMRLNKLKNKHTQRKLKRTEKRGSANVAAHVNIEIKDYGMTYSLRDKN